MEGDVVDQLISIVVPVYNAEKYLPECIESIINQTYENIEILLIDDGSKDNSGKICDEYSSKDKRIKVIHKANGGVSSARNTGLDNARGKYVTFVDSDDLIATEYISKLYMNVLGRKSDLAFCRFASYVEGMILPVREEIPLTVGVGVRDKQFIDFVSRFFNSKEYISSSSCRILYKASTIKGVRFNPHIRIGEDWIFLLNAIFCSNTVSSINDVLYFYRKNATSATNSYKRNYLQNQLELQKELEKLFSSYDMRYTMKAYNTLLCYYAFSNEIKFRPKGWHKNIRDVRKSELYPYFKLKDGLKLHGKKQKIKFLIIWFLVKFRLV